MPNIIRVPVSEMWTFVMGRMLGGPLGQIIIMIPILGILVLLFFFLLALFQGLLIFLTTLWLYPLFIGLAIIVGIFLRISTKSKVISALALWGILILGCTGSTFYYINGNVKFPTMYNAGNRRFLTCC